MALLSIHHYLTTYLVFGAMLFSLGVYGLVTRKTLIGMLIAAELMLAGVSINFMAFNRFLAPDPSVGQIFTLFIMAIAAAEAAIGLSIVVAVYRHYKTVDAEELINLKG
ncbi:MAG: NADH-quinone oxidoreductase subunit NuoK [Desulfofustis sp.]|nr:NADH-quinone oxidoreductase subunit NuoK [Desulfofustis sp.]RZW18663.1 MAG: NADH-quinone oxidoreductase subunit NuoK [Desulfobulbaceae bacterium]MBT8347239.1 NADH-quinone oxidoreductase subunit NuoK [Desulfofustis sp.]MBT8355400.1 NADH-quinone oxidoreductase subunit NuoK [Desulfofustis sp.]NNF47596.1 NADH-quinone oxidoreductase subunit NuoK [Desulfofustis sp.]